MAERAAELADEDVPAAAPPAAEAALAPAAAAAAAAGASTAKGGAKKGAKGDKGEKAASGGGSEAWGGGAAKGGKASKGGTAGGTAAMAVEVVELAMPPTAPPPEYATEMLVLRGIHGMPDVRAAFGFTLLEGPPPPTREAVLRLFAIKAWRVPSPDRRDVSDPHVQFSLVGAAGEEGEGSPPPPPSQPPPPPPQQPGEAAQGPPQAGHVTTAVLLNQVNPEWDDVLELRLPAGTARPPRLRVRLWDQDQGEDDDLLAQADVELSTAREGSVGRLMLQPCSRGRSIQCSFSFALL